MPTVTRITNTGTLFVNGTFDEITTSTIRVTTNTVFASDLDEVTGMGFLPNMLTYFDAGKIESYNFNYDSRRLVDLSTSSRIVMQNTTTWVSTFSGGLSYPVVSGTVSGTEPWVQLQDSVLNNRSSGTISAWIQYTAFSRSGDYHDNFGQAIVSRQRDGVGTWAHLSVSGFVNSAGGPVLGTTGKIYWHPRNGIAPANSTANLAYNTVYHVAVSFDTSGCRFYINGVLDSTTAGDYSIPSSQEATFGTAVAVWRYGGEYYMPWSGYIYSMKFYNAALNLEQVAENYNADAARFSLAPITNSPVQRQYSTGRLAVSGLFDDYTFSTYGSAVYATTGTFTWTVPANVTSISILAVGGGGSGGGYGGGGGALAYKNNVAVTPGQTYSLTVGWPNPFNSEGSATSSTFGLTVPLVANGGRGGNVNGANGSIGIGQGFDGGGAGGAGGGDAFVAGVGYVSGGSGGAGGYTASGGAGATYPGTGTAGTGGSGGGGGFPTTSTFTSRGGGGVGIYGLGLNGAVSGGGGSGGLSQNANVGGKYGGGGPGISTPSGLGATGVVRIVWPGDVRRFPSTGDLSDINETTI